MKKLSLASLAFAALMTSAMAADLPTKAPPYREAVATGYNWSGSYIGIEGGWAWGRTNHRDLTPTPFDRGPWDIDGGLVGATFGYNWQMGQIVLGLESDISWSHIHKDFAGLNCNTGLCFTDIRALGTNRARFGYAMNNWLWYVTGGLAVGRVRAGIYGCTPDCIDTKTRLGWTAGGGVEWGLAPNWSLKVEYLFVDLGDRVNYSTGFDNKVSVSTSIIRGGLNFHLPPL